MPFQKGNKLAKNQGRKGYQIEQAQLDKMRKIVGMDLNVLEKVYKGVAKEEDLKKLLVGKDRIAKFVDKLHATKESHEHSGEINLPVPLLNALSHNNSDKKDSSADQKN